MLNEFVELLKEESSVWEQICPDIAQSASVLKGEPFLSSHDDWSRDRDHQGNAIVSVVFEGLSADSLYVCVCLSHQCYN